MNAPEVQRLVEIVRRAVPHQTLDQAAVLLWDRILGDLPYRDAEAAVLAVLGQRPYVAPSEVRDEARRVQRARVEGVDLSLLQPVVEPDDVAAYTAEGRALRALVAAGEWGEVELVAYQRRGVPLTAGASARPVSPLRDRPVEVAVAAAANRKALT